jgi:flavin-dependent dehydrogenase
MSLASRGVRVLLLEEKRMPREKLCGEFVTPECFPTLERLGVMDRMLAAGAQRITRVSLIVANGKSVKGRVAKMSRESNWAMSLSRARFDQILFERAREVGAECLEAIAVKDCVVDGRMSRVEATSLPGGSKVSFTASLIIDASGRNSRLMVGRRERIGGSRGSRLYALKAHLEGVEAVDDRVELYFFPQGYGGLSPVEDGLANLCFIVDERSLRKAEGDPSTVVKHTLMNNPVARERLRSARVAGKWHSAGPLTFGRRRLSREGIIAIGDASGMIDPFTGTGIQMALRTGEMAAEAILEAWQRKRADCNASTYPERPGRVRSRATVRSGWEEGLVPAVLTRYAESYETEFRRRLKMAGLLRTAAFSPHTASLVASVLTHAPGLTSFVLRATRSGGGSLQALE